MFCLALDTSLDILVSLRGTLLFYDRELTYAFSNLQIVHVNRQRDPY